MEGQATFKQASETMASAQAKRQLPCAALSAVAAGWYFIAELAYNYLAFSVHELFSWQLLFLAALGLLLLGAMIRLVSAIWSPRERISKIICSSAIIICVILSFRFASNLQILADKVFYLANNSWFREKTENYSEQPIIVHGFSSHTSHKFFIYTRSRTLPNGPVDSTALTSLFNKLDTFTGCRADTRSLGGGFYVLKADCR